ncbi:MAG: dienelactone hydrolase family protein [Granulosicoccaceae bacterium]
MQNRAVSFRCDDQEFTLEVYLPSVPARGTVLVCHAWGGQAELEINRAKQLAEAGYIGIAHDVYGTAVRGGTAEQNEALMRPLINDRDALARRLQAGLEAAAALPQVDADKMAAIGFCFGGLCVFDMARRNMRVKAVVSFHGIFSPLPVPSSAIAPKVLALHGYDDPLASPEELVAFGNEMSAAGADWQIHAYGGTSHSFSNPAANSPEKGNVYFERSDVRATRSMLDFLADVFSEE